MKVCVVGSGGREHALALALARTADVVVTPGNPGMSGRRDTEAVRRRPESERITVTSAVPEQIDADLFVIGPEQPLVEGLADRLRADKRLVFGPGADGARLEGSKAFIPQHGSRRTYGDTAEQRLGAFPGRLQPDRFFCRERGAIRSLSRDLHYPRQP